MVEEVDTIVLEDNNSYMITNELVINNTKYLLLTNENDITKYCIRKIKNINNEEYLVGLDSEEELNQVLSVFMKNKPSAN